MFTIEVKKRGKDEKFSFEDLEMFHQECYEGGIKKSQYYQGIGGCLSQKIETPLEINDDAYDYFLSGWKLTCQRCWVTKLILADVQGLEIIKTAIDGKERKIGEDIVVIQKT